jgi:hypothetical protein
VSTVGSWLALAGLGAFHGLNPAMGWLFALARGLQQRRREVVLRSLVPIALGHALSVALIVLAVGGLRLFIDTRKLQLAAGGVLIAFGVYRLLARHRGRGGMQVSEAQLVLWSFLMASAHGAGLMLVPVLLAMPADAINDMSMHHHMPMPLTSGSTQPSLASSLAMALTAVSIHTMAMLAVAGAIALSVYQWVGVAFLRRGWVNLDWLWIPALLAAGASLLAMGLL